MKNKIRTLVIVSIVFMVFIGFLYIFPQDVTISSYQTTFAQMGFNFITEDTKNVLILSGIATLITSIGTSVYALLVLKKATKKSVFIAPGILLIIFNGLFGIIAGIMTLCLKQEEINK